MILVLVKELIEVEKVELLEKVEDLNVVDEDEVDDCAGVVADVDSDVEGEEFVDCAEGLLIGVCTSADAGGGGVKEIGRLVFFLVKL